MNREEKLAELRIDIYEKAWDLADAANEALGYVPHLIQNIVDYTGFIVRSNPDQPRVPSGLTTGGQFTADGTNGGVPTGWGGNAAHLQKHFEDHKNDFGAKTPQEYVDQAKGFYQRFQDENLPAVENDSGYTKVYDPGTNTFGVYDPGGDPVTFYKPTSPNYYDNEIQKVLDGGGKVINPYSGGGGSGGGSVGVPTGKPGDNSREPWDILE